MRSLQAERKECAKALRQDWARPVRGAGRLEWRGCRCVGVRGKSEEVSRENSGWNWGKGRP